ncbi:hypothetical protein NQZ68_009968 [Dissostichus eleginoides]|nr:hypothetical protein NQZ68_009968 [Dissostichus eleginoides]
MIDDVTFHPYPKESLPGKRKRAGLSLMTSRVMYAIEDLGLKVPVNSTLTSRGSPAALDVIEIPAYDIILLLEINKFTLR